MRVVIIGNGVAGITAARTLRKRSNWDIVVISHEAPYHFARPAMMYVSMGHLTFQNTKPYEDSFWRKNRIELVHDEVVAVRSKGADTLGTYTVHCSSGYEVKADAVILATGSVESWYNWPGEHLRGVQAYITKAHLDELEENIRGVRNAVVVGGGLIGVEVAEVLHSRGLHVTMLVREPLFYGGVFPREEATLLTKHITSRAINLRCNTELRSIVPNTSAPERVGGCILSNGTTAEAGVVVLATGVKPNTGLAEAVGLRTDRGIVVDEFFRTSLPNVYAIGDCAQLPHGVEQLWYTAKAHGERIAHNLTGAERPYQQGPYFNSAKFFDVEWQVYGNVPQSSNKHNSLLWQSADENRLVRICHVDGNVIGIHGLGVRLRQNVCEQWITNNTSLEDVQKNFTTALFDAEFSPKVAL